MKNWKTRVTEIDKLIDAVDLKRIDENFVRQEIAIYDEIKLYFQNRIVSFDQNGLNLNYNIDFSIINSDDILDDDVINAGIFVKKMVFNRFYSSNDSRIPNDLLALDYPQIYLNFDYMRYERQLLAKAFSSNDKYIMLSFLRMFLNVRDLRRQLIGDTFSNLEYCLETIEGLSQFAMYEVICELDKKKMKNRLKELMTIFNNANRNYFDFRHGNIYSGLVVLIILDELQINFRSLYHSDETIYQFIVKKIPFYRENITFKSDKTLLGNWNDYTNAVRDKFTTYFDNDPMKCNGSFQIYAYDPERIFKDKGNIYHESFVILKDLSNNNLIYLKGPIITKVLDNSYDIVTTYYKIGGRKHAN